MRKEPERIFFDIVKDDELYKKFMSESVDNNTDIINKLIIERTKLNEEAQKAFNKNIGEYGISFIFDNTNIHAVGNILEGYGLDKEYANMLHEVIAKKDFELIERILLDHYIDISVGSFRNDINLNDYVAPYLIKAFGVDKALTFSKEELENDRKFSGINEKLKTIYLKEDSKDINTKLNEARDLLSYYALDPYMKECSDNPSKKAEILDFYRDMYNIDSITNVLYPEDVKKM